MNDKKVIKMIWFGVVLSLFAGIAFAENIDPNNDDMQYAYGENVGWLNFEPDTGDGAQVAGDKLTGWVWAENIGWISLSCENTSSCGTVSFGVTNDGAGNLSGYAWGENVGWISFSCDNTASCVTADYGVTIDADSAFDGYAWAENVGWINFGIDEYYVKTCVVTFEDLANFTSLWLQSGTNPANLDNTGDVDLSDYGILAGYWQDYCPDGWLLK